MRGMRLGPRLLLGLALLPAAAFGCGSDPAAGGGDSDGAADADGGAAGEVVPSDAPEVGEIDSGPVRTCAGKPEVQDLGNGCCVVFPCEPDDLWLHCQAGSEGQSCQCGVLGDECGFGEITGGFTDPGEPCAASVDSLWELCGFGELPPSR